MIHSPPKQRWRQLPMAALAVVLIGHGIAVLPARGWQPLPALDFGDPLPGLTRAQYQRFLDGKDAFTAVHSEESGLGPVFNGNSCRQCHLSPVTGGGSVFRAIRIGSIVDGVFDPLLRSGGPTIQKFGANGLFGFEFFGEMIPPDATIIAERRANPLFGLGLVEAVSDEFLEKSAQKQREATPRIAGRTNRVRDLKTGQWAVGRFGWKASRATLLDFSAEAYKDELGITVPGYVADEDGRNVSEENPPQGQTDLLKFNLVNSPNLDSDLNVRRFRDFMTLLAPPPPLALTDEGRRGQSIFQSIGCSQCHTPSLQTGPNAVAALDRATFQPYSDFLLHDMGPLGDGIEQGRATGREMRTAPLWGLRGLASFLHDGRASTLDEAIRFHDGQARDAVKRYLKLPPQDELALVAFLLSIWLHFTIRRPTSAARQLVG